uniref:Protein kinase domain-containing protein n=1 Tax=Chromera velia CCMP2878 TaxID=1169474 RepID=A0A0G4F1P8_9ALVE|eukprot:Cvel_14605.t1-p1 / transcript=Cvel_14605.t1 / gene=Cvel_14605 / organism=Chromera_velia_CCMP2878 / gene_product=Serine/threonine-protein kinase CTR1, putative / transcript_product=Serine/threonine-protein kinase CTR1, putative / location=Cvel_scaffold1044:31337-34865(+) / protein_length=775 / sequence_SO=supercontig / SO=protein_coding / is_pseudo=false
MQMPFDVGEDCVGSYNYCDDDNDPEPKLDIPLLISRPGAHLAFRLPRFVVQHDENGYDKLKRTIAAHFHVDISQIFQIRVQQVLGEPTWVESEADVLALQGVDTVFVRMEGDRFDIAALMEFEEISLRPPEALSTVRQASMSDIAFIPKSIGRGPVFHTYRGVWRDLDVAVRLPPDAAVVLAGGHASHGLSNQPAIDRMFHRELQVLASVRHPRILSLAAVLTTPEEDSVVAILTHFVIGRSLADIIATDLQTDFVHVPVHEGHLGLDLPSVPSPIPEVSEPGPARDPHTFNGSPSPTPTGGGSVVGEDRGQSPHTGGGCPVDIPRLSSMDPHPTPSSRQSPAREVGRYGFRRSLTWRCHWSTRHMLQIACDIAEGMCYLHERGIVHGNLKPTNIYVDAECRARVGDFTLARLGSQWRLKGGEGRVPGGWSSSDYAGGVVTVGSARYMAPEVLSGWGSTEEGGRRGDVYSFGVLLWELLNKREPWGGLSDEEVIDLVGYRGHRLPVETILETCVREHRSDGFVAMVAVCSSCMWHALDRPSFSEILSELRVALEAEKEQEMTIKHVASVPGKLGVNRNIPKELESLVSPAPRPGPPPPLSQTFELTPSKPERRDSSGSRGQREGILETPKHGLPPSLEELRTPVSSRAGQNPAEGLGADSPAAALSHLIGKFRENLLRRVRLSRAKSGCTDRASERLLSDADRLCTLTDLARVLHRDAPPRQPSSAARHATSPPVGLEGGSGARLGSLTESQRAAVEKLKAIKAELQEEAKGGGE